MGHAAGFVSNPDYHGFESLTITASQVSRENSLRQKNRSKTTNEGTGKRGKNWKSWRAETKDILYEGTKNRGQKSLIKKKKSITSAVMDDYEGLNLSPTATRTLAFLT